jgi:guanine nucleotide-binding protein subunit beta-2-like 1 protein
MSNSNVSFSYIGFLEGHNGWVTSLVVGENPDGSPLVISGSRDKSIIIWKLNLNEPESVVIKPAEDKFAEIRDNKIGKPLKSLHGHNHFISSLSLSSDSKKLVSASWDKTARLWDLPTASTQKIFKDHNKDLLAVIFSHDERMIFTGSMDNTLKYWNNQGENKYTVPFKGWISCILNIKKGKEHYMAVGSWDSSVTIFDSGYTVLRRIEGNDYAVTSLSCDDEGDFLFIAYKNGTVKVWSFAGSENNDQCKSTFEASADINVVNFESEYFQVYAIGTTKDIQVRKIKREEKGKEVIFEKNFNNSPCLCIAYDKSKKYMFAGFGDGTIRVFEVGKASE